MNKLHADKLNDTSLERVRTAFENTRCLMRFSAKASRPMFDFLFEERGQHLFEEVFCHKCNRDALKFLQSVDRETLDIIIVNLFGHEKVGRPARLEDNPLFMFG